MLELIFKPSELDNDRFSSEIKAKATTHPQQEPIQRRLTEQDLVPSTRLPSLPDSRFAQQNSANQIKMAEIHKDRIVACNTSLFTSQLYSDIIIRCGTDEYKLHRAIICPRSTFFAAACNGAFMVSINWEEGVGLVW